MGIIVISVFFFFHLILSKNVYPVRERRGLVTIDLLRRRVCGKKKGGYSVVRKRVKGDPNK